MEHYERGDRVMVLANLEAGQGAKHPLVTGPGIIDFTGTDPDEYGILMVPELLPEYLQDRVVEVLVHRSQLAPVGPEFVVEYPDRKLRWTASGVKGL